MAKVLGMNSATCYLAIKLVFGVVSAQKDPVKIKGFCTSQSLGFQKVLFSYFPLT
jgi:hypothetical protein